MLSPISNKVHAALVKTSKLVSRRGLYPFLRREFGAIPAGSTVLTIGSGGSINAVLSEYAASQDLEVVSFDIDPARGPDIVGDLCAYDWEGRTFDVVVCAEVLEHCHSPHLAVETIHAALRPGGRLILTVPFLFPIHEAPYDYYRYTRHGLEFLLKAFRDVTIEERNSYLEAVDVLYARLAQAKDTRARLAAYPVVLGVVARWPLTYALGKLVATDVGATGYVVTAVKAQRA